LYYISFRIISSINEHAVSVSRGVPVYFPNHAVTDDNLPKSCRAAWLRPRVRQHFEATRGAKLAPFFPDRATAR